MSVRVADQKETDLWYVNAIYELCKETNTMVSKRKQNLNYRAYVPKILDCSVYLLQEARTANEIMISKNASNEDYLKRRQHLQNALGYLDTYESLIDLYVNICMVEGSYNNGKAFNFFNIIGGKIQKIRSSIIKIIKKDLDKLRKIEKEKIQSDIFCQLNAQKLWYEAEIKRRKDNGTVIQPIVFFDTNQKLWYEAEIKRRKDNGTVIQPIVFFGASNYQN